MKKIIFILFLCLLALPLVNAQPPFEIDATEGFAVEPVLTPVITQGQDYNFAIHVFNKSNGNPIISGISCYLHVYNFTGDHIVILEQDTPSDIFDYGFSIDGENFTQVGFYQFKSQCNSSLVGGGLEIEIEVTETGRSFGVQQAIIILIPLVLLALISVLILIIALKTQIITIRNFCYGASLLLLTFLIGYTLRTLQLVTPEFTTLIGLTRVSFIIFAFASLMGVLALIIYLIVLVLTLFYKSRGLAE